MPTPISETPIPETMTGADFSNGAPVSLSFQRIVGCLFLLSGFCALVYEVLWCRQLGLIFGNTVQSLSAVLTAFMGGLALGSFVAGRLCHRIRRPLLVYGLLELLIGAYCMLLPWALGDHGPLVPFYQMLYGETGGDTLSVARFGMSFLLLLIPTTFMGATLPVLSHLLVRSNESMGRTVGTLYALNTFGAVLGAAATGFVLLPFLGKLGTNQVAVVCNIVLGLSAMVLSWWAMPSIKNIGATTALPEKNSDSNLSPESKKTSQLEPIPANAIRFAVFTFGLTGFAAMATQIAWTRAISLGTGSSTYAFSLIVSVFILGLSLGGMWASRLIRKLADPLSTLANVLLSIGLYGMALASLLGLGPLLFYFLIAWGSDPHGGEMNWGLLLLIQALGIALLIFIPTFLMGATLPLTLHVASGNSKDAGKTVGTLYAINTLGSILGSFLGGLVILPFLQLQTTLQVMALLYAVPGIVLAAMSPSWRATGQPLVEMGKMGKMGKINAESGAQNAGTISSKRSRRLQIALFAAALLSLLTPRWDPNIMSAGMFLLRDPKTLAAAREFRLSDALPNLGNCEMLYYREGVSATVSVVKINHLISLSVGGKPDASSGADMSTQIGLSLVPAILHPEPKDVLVIGLGSGVSTGAALARKSVQHVDVVEMSPEVVEGSAWFEPYNHLTYERSANGQVSLNTPKVQLLLNDGRNHLLLTSRKYDLIASEPSNPWMAGVGNLFTQEAFQLARQHLKSGGLMCQWIHSYNLEESNIHSIITTFGKVFPHLQLWWINKGDYLLIGSDDPISIPLLSLRERLSEPKVKDWLQGVHLDTEEEFLAGFILHDEHLKHLASNGQLHTDDNMLLEFSAPRALYSTHPRLFSTVKIPSLPERIVDRQGLSSDDNSAFLRKLDLAVGAREHLLLSVQTGFDKVLSANHLERAWQMAPYQYYANDFFVKKTARGAKSAKPNKPDEKTSTADDTSKLRVRALEALDKQHYDEALGLLHQRYIFNPDQPQALQDSIEAHLKVATTFKPEASEAMYMYACMARRLSHQLTQWKPDLSKGWECLAISFEMLATLDTSEAEFYRNEAAKAREKAK